MVDFNEGNVNTDIISVDKTGRPVSLIGGGHHFMDAPHNRMNITKHLGLTPMDRIMESVNKQNLMRPKGVGKR
eukprot:7568769-Ditylum_brightwellii.AAC.1